MNSRYRNNEHSFVDDGKYESREAEKASWKQRKTYFNIQQNLNNTTNLGLCSKVVQQNKKQSRHDAFFVVFDGETFGKSKMSMTEFVLRNT